MTTNLGKLGYNYKGLYQEGVDYGTNDVTKKDGTMQVYNGSSFEIFAPNQQLATSHGELVMKNSAASGAEGQQLFINSSGVPEFMHGDERSSTTVLKMLNTQRADHAARATQRYFSCIMVDGTVRSWGNANEGQNGTGRDNDSSVSKPANVGFPPDTPSIIDLISLQHSTYAIDAEGGLWSWGNNAYGELGLGHDSTGTATNVWTNVPNKVNGNGDLPADAKVIKVATGDGYYGYRNVMIMTEDRKVYFSGLSRYYASGTSGDDGEIHSPRLVLRSQMLLDEGKYVEEMFSFGQYHMGTFLLDNEGCLWCAGEQNTIGRVQNNGNTNVPHEKMTYFEHKPIKSIVGNESDWHATEGSQYYRKYAIVFQDGDIATWGHTGKGTEVSTRAGDWSPTIDPRISNVREVFLRTSYHDYQSITAVKNDGTLFHIGYGGYEVGGIGTTTSWRNVTTSVNSKLSSIEKAIWGASTYGAAMAILRTDGRVISWGLTASGKAGTGQLTTEEGAEVADYARIPEKAIDIMYGGYWNGGSDYGCLFILGESGTLWSVGSGSYSLNGMDDDSENTTTPNRVLF